MGKQVVRGIGGHGTLPDLCLCSEFITKRASFTRVLAACWVPLRVAQNYEEKMEKLKLEQKYKSVLLEVSPPVWVSDQSNSVSLH